MTLLRNLSSQPYALLTLTAVMWAGNAIAGKLAVGHISPFLLTSSRWCIASLILVTLAWRHLRRDWPVIARQWPFLALLGAIGFALFNDLLYLALTHTTAINVAIEQAAMPLIVFLLNFLLFQIRTTWLQVSGFVLTLVGVVITATQGNPFGMASQPVNIGDLYMIGAVLAYGVYSVALARKPALHWLSFIAVLVTSAFVASLPATIWEIANEKVIWPDGQGWMVALYTAIFPSILAQIMWIRGLEMIGSNRGGVFINLVPIFAAVMAVAMLGEALHLHQAVAMVLVMTGVWIAQRKPAR